jgi:hypothetical protein
MRTCEKSRKKREPEWQYGLALLSDVFNVVVGPRQAAGGARCMRCSYAFL